MGVSVQAKLLLYGTAAPPKDRVVTIGEDIRLHGHGLPDGSFRGKPTAINLGLDVFNDGARATLVQSGVGCSLVDGNFDCLFIEACF